MVFLSIWQLDHLSGSLVQTSGWDLGEEMAFLGQTSEFHLLLLLMSGWQTLTSQIDIKFRRLGMECDPRFTYYLDPGLSTEGSIRWRNHLYSMLLLSYTTVKDAVVRTRCFINHKLNMHEENLKIYFCKQVILYEPILCMMFFPQPDLEFIWNT